MKDLGRTTSLLALFVVAALLVTNCTASPTPVPEPQGLGEALTEAVLAGDSADVERLLEAGADADVESLSGPIIVLAATGGKADIVKLLAEHGADLDAQSPSGRTPLAAAALSGHIAVIERLLDQGANIDKSDAASFRLAPLAVAAAEGELEVVELLLARGADPNRTNQSGTAALHLAAESGHTEIAELLIARGADVSLVDGTGSAALHWAAASGHTEVGQLLIAAGADINLQDGGGNPALTCVSLGRGSPDFAQLLVDEGAALDLVNSEGLTPLGVAEEKGWQEVSDVLRTAGAEDQTRSSRQDLPAALEMPERTIRQVNWGSMNVEQGDIRQIIDAAPLLKGLPDDR